MENQGSLGIELVTATSGQSTPIAVTTTTTPPSIPSERHDVAASDDQAASEEDQQRKEANASTDSRPARAAADGRKVEERRAVLEKKMEKLNNTIRKLDEQECDLESMQSEESVYLLQDRRKRELVQTWHDYCKLVGQSPHISPERARRFSLDDCPLLQDKKINRRLVDYAYKAEFPCRDDMRRLLKKCVRHYKLDWSTEEQYRYVDEAFKRLGGQFQKYRRKTFWDDHGSDLTDRVVAHIRSRTTPQVDTNVGNGRDSAPGNRDGFQLPALEGDFEDPAANDPELETKLKQNRLEGQQKMNALFQEFERKQEVAGSGEGEGENEEDDEAGDEDEDAEEEDDEEVSMVGGNSGESDDGASIEDGLHGRHDDSSDDDSTGDLEPRDFPADANGPPPVYCVSSSQDNTADAQDDEVGEEEDSHRVSFEDSGESEREGDGDANMAVQDELQSDGSCLDTHRFPAAPSLLVPEFGGAAGDVEFDALSSDGEAPAIFSASEEEEGDMEIAVPTLASVSMETTEVAGNPSPLLSGGGATAGGAAAMPTLIPLRGRVLAARAGVADHQQPGVKRQHPADNDDDVPAKRPVPVLKSLPRAPASSWSPPTAGPPAGLRSLTFANPPRTFLARRESPSGGGGGAVKQEVLAEALAEATAAESVDCIVILSDTD